MFRRIVLIISVLSAVDSVAWAQDYPRSYPGTPQEQKACRGDAGRFCRGMNDPSEVRACLVSHRQQLTSGCRRVLQRHGY